MGYLKFTNINELLRIMPESLVYITASGNYSTIVTANGAKHTLTLQLGYIEEIIGDMLDEIDSDTEFLRIGRSLLVNLNYVTEISIINKLLVLSDSKTFRYVLEASKEALKSLKRILEEEKI